MSVLVADSNGNPAPPGTVVNLSAWPIAWSTGSGCAVDADTATTGTFYNEDTNENLILDAGEDGTRRHYTTGATEVAGVTKDGSVTPPNSSGGTLPSQVIIDSSLVTPASGSCERSVGNDQWEWRGFFQFNVYQEECALDHHQN